VRVIVIVFVVVFVRVVVRVRVRDFVQPCLRKPELSGSIPA
jgi:hypothetical protein